MVKETINLFDFGCLGRQRLYGCSNHIKWVLSSHRFATIADASSMGCL
jgi:hypothetical protein